MSKKKRVTVSSEASKRKFRLGPSGTCEALLFEFSNESCPGAEGLHAEKTISTTHRIAACSMLEAAEYMVEFEPDFQTQSVRTIGLIVMLSGSEFN